MSEPVVLRTSRLVLRPIGPDDADELYDAVLSRPEVMRWLATGRPGTRDDARRACRDHAEHWREHGLGDLAVRDAVTGELLGRVGFRCRPEHGTDLGFALGPEAQGRGVAREAGAACLQHAFGDAGLDVVHAFVLPGNERSVALLRRLGAVPSGTAVSSGNPCLRFTFHRPSAESTIGPGVRA